jgi:hypothetical protein
MTRTDFTRTYRSSQEVPENESRNVDIVLLVHDNGNPFPVVLHRDLIGLGIDHYINLVHIGIALFVICCVHDIFVKDLEQTGCECNLALDNTVVGIQHVHGLRQTFHRSD